MHEWALAESVVRAAADYAREKGLKGVGRVTVRLGELQNLDRECFDFALAEIAKQAGLGDIVVSVEVEPARFACRVCGAAWALRDCTGDLSDEKKELIHFLPEAAKAYVRCPSCRSPDFELTCGRGISVEYG
jgi:hydrogenase nickel incorporation protein HypA/HybF